MAVALTVPAVAGKFYNPAEYRWFLESVDLTAGLRPSQPVCRVIDTGTKFPAVLKPEIMFKKAAGIKDLRCVMIFRRGLVGAVSATVKFTPGADWKLPYLPADFYSVLVKCFDKTGNMAYSSRFCLNIVEDSTTQTIRVAPTVDKDIFTATVSGGKLAVNGIAASKDPATIHVIARNSFGNKLFEQLFKVAPGARGGEFQLEDIRPGQIMELDVRLESPDRVIDRTGLFYFKRGSYPAVVPNWRKLAPPQSPAGGLVIEENQLMMGPFEQNLPGLTALVKGMKARGSDMINLNFKWFQVEPVTGVYDWSEFDKYVKFFTEKGIRFGMIVGGGIFDSAPYDIWGDWMMDDQGRCRVWRNLGVFSPSSKKYRQAITGLVREVYKRYGSNPYFMSWMFSGQGLDSGIFMDHFDRVTDYSRWARADFTCFLKDKYKTLDKLNQAWNSSFKTWGEVMPPLPDWKKEVDISQPWLDFNACKLKIYADSNTGVYDPTVRALDKKRPIVHYLTYTGPIEYLFPALKRTGSHLCDGGGESHQMVRLYSIINNWDIRRRPESHYVPADKRRQFQDLVTNTMRYGLKNSDIGMVWNSMVNVHANVYPKNAGLKDSMRFWTGVLPTLRELSDSQKVAPPVGFILSWDDLFCRTRAWRWYALPGDELQRSAAKASLGNVTWLSGITPERVYDRLKLIVCDYDNRVFSPELLDRLTGFVKRGGSLVICADAGEYTVGSKEKYLWRKSFKAPADLTSGGVKEWKFGRGRVIYSDKPVSSQPDGKFLLEMMRRCGIKRQVVSDNPAVQGFLLKNGSDLILVVSAFKGFDALRQLKNTATILVTITIPGIPSGRWEQIPMYPAGQKAVLDAETLHKKGLKFNIEPSGIIIIKLHKIK